MVRRAAAAKAASKTGRTDRSRALAPQTVGGKPAAGAVGLNPVIHERVRLAIVSALAVNDSLSFNDLKAQLKTTDGNLSVHARKLEKAGYLSCRKYFAGRMPRTDYRLTAAGRKALERYLKHMEALIQAARR